VSDALLNLLFFAVVATWLGGVIVQAFRYWRKRNTYLRRFPPVAGVPLDMYLGTNPFNPVSRASIRAVWEPQDDPELEGLRREMWRAVGYLFLWMFGFPMLVSGMVILVLLLLDPPW